MAQGVIYETSPRAVTTAKKAPTLYYGYVFTFKTSWQEVCRWW